MSNGELVRIPGKKHLSYYELIRNSAVYAFSDKVAILIFGIILIVLSNLENYILVSQDALLSKRILLVGIIVVVLTIFEAGYSFKIKEETLRGSKRPPLFNHFKEMFRHGLKDFIIDLAYLLLMLLLIVISIIGSALYKEYSMILPLLALFLITILTLIQQSAIINLAYHDGEFKSAFDFKQIYRLMHAVGFKRMVVIFILWFICDYLILTSIFHEGIFVENTIFTFCLNLVITPFITIFTERLFMLSTL